MCLGCENDYELIENSCKLVKNVSFEVFSINNPYIFEIRINENWKFFYEKYEQFIKSINIQGLLNSTDYTYKYDYDNNNLSLFFDYKTSFNDT